MKHFLVLPLTFLPLLALAGEDLAALEVGRFLDLPGETTVINEMVTTVKAKGEARGQTFQTNERCVFRGRDDYRLVKRNLVTGATLSLSVLGRSAEIDKRYFEGELSEHGNVERIDRFDRMRDEVIVAFLELHRRFSKYLQLQRTKEDDLSVEYLGSRFPPPAGEGAFAPLFVFENVAVSPQPHFTRNSLPSPAGGRRAGDEGARGSRVR